MKMNNLYEILETCDIFINEIEYFEPVEIATDFYCYPNTREIFISILASEASVNDFTNNLTNRTDIDDISEFTWSLLHEVGHCMTYHKLNKRTQNHCKNIKRKIDRGSIPTAIYYTLPDEKMATDWAIGYIECNHTVVKTFDDAVMELLMKFYQDNEITED